MSLLWPVTRPAEVVSALARRAGLPMTPPVEEAVHASQGAEEIPRLSRHRGLEAVPVAIPWPAGGTVLERCGPAVLHVPGRDGDEGGYLAVLHGARGRVTLLRPDGRAVQTSPRRLDGMLRGRWDGEQDGPLQRLLREAGIPQRPVRAGRSPVREAGPVGDRARAWLLRVPAEGSFLRQLWHGGVVGDLVGFVGAYAVSYSMLLASWWVLGAGALEGRLVGGWLAAWALLLLCLLPARYLSTWSRSRLGVTAGGLLKRRLFHGALRLGMDEGRRQGAGQYLGRILESEEVESKTLAGGYLTIVAFIELALSLVVLAYGAGGWFQVALAVIWLLVVLWLGWRFLVSRRRWTELRLDMTHDLVEGIVGRRTRLAQEPPERRHEAEDGVLARYLDLSARYDRWKAWLLGLGGRGWVLVGLVGLVPAYLAQGSSRVALAIGLGGVLSAYRGFGKLAEGLSHWTGAIVGWEQVRDLFRAAGRGQSLGLPGLSEMVSDAREGETLLEANDLVLSHAERSEPVLAGCSLTIRRGERILLEGPSGGGKSTFAAVLASLRSPDRGLVLLRGLDLGTVGEERWRRAVALAPQFHENHVVTETLAFNLLLGRGWPPGEGDLADAEEICRELGLGPLLDRMPGGLQQVVGETGWQLSHGEKSRLFLARALLQGTNLVILDEAFAGLDPPTLARALACAVRRAPTLLVVAHP